MLEALFALSRKAVENEPLKIFMAISDIDRNRASRSSAATVDRLARDYHNYGSQYPLFSESRSISDKSIIAVPGSMAAISKVKDPPLHSDLAGTFQALVGLWQILVRQQSIPDAQADAVFSGIVGGFAAVKGNRELFDAGPQRRETAARRQRRASQRPARTGCWTCWRGESRRCPKPTTQMVQDLMRILEAQRIVSLDTLFQLADHIEAIAKGEKLNPQAGQQTGQPHQRNPVAARLAVRQRKERDGLRLLDRAAHRSGAQAEPARRHREGRGRSGEGQGHPRACWRRCCAIRCSPSTTRTTRRRERRSSTPTRSSCAATISSACRAPITPGAPPNSTAPAGPPTAADAWWARSRRLPYALAEAEQNFLIPTQTQALIWGDLVPQMILSAKIPRWWNVTPAADALGRPAPALRPRTAGRSRARYATCARRCSTSLGTLRRAGAHAPGGAAPGTGRRPRRRSTA